MKEINFSCCTEEELWHYVAGFLSLKNIDTVLVGGAVVSIYSNSIYQSGDLDMVTHYPMAILEKELNKIGFLKEGRHFIHPECHHIFIEFVPPPVAIGDDYNILPDEVKINNKVIKILSPTDCIKDRLASYIHFQARECLEQAILVAKRHPFHKNAIREWCFKEKAREEYQEFIESG